MSMAGEGWMTWFAVKIGSIAVAGKNGSVRMEVAYKTITREPWRISWTMLVAAILLTVPVERCGEQLPWAVPPAVLLRVVGAVLSLHPGLRLDALERGGRSAAAIQRILTA